MGQFERTELVLGVEAVQKLKASHVIVFGCGGVGGYVIEALVRSGIGELTVVDNDTVSESNLNRQIIALHSTVGKLKIDVIEQRVLDINPELKFHKVASFVLPENIGQFDFTSYDYVIDCIDTVSAKLVIIEGCCQTKSSPVVPVITSLGTGNKLNPMGFKVSVVEKTNVCPLARVMRRELKSRGIKDVKCVYSEEKPANLVADSANGRHSPGSISFVPAAAGLLIASEVIKDLVR